MRAMQAIPVSLRKTPVSLNKTPVSLKITLVSLQLAYVPCSKLLFWDRGFLACMPRLTHMPDWLAYSTRSFKINIPVKIVCHIYHSFLSPKCTNLN